ncbi:hypothetical protein [Streptomyces sp. NPDC054849]
MYEAPAALATARWPLAASAETDWLRELAAEDGLTGFMPPALPDAAWVLHAMYEHGLVPFDMSYVAYQRKTVRRYRNKDLAGLLASAQDRGHGVLDTFIEHVQQRFLAGCTSSMQLYRQLLALGYTGGYHVVEGSGCAQVPWTTGSRSWRSAPESRTSTGRRSPRTPGGPEPTPT